MEATAKLRNVPTSPRKMRMVANLVRGQKVTRALGLLKFEANSGAEKIEKLLLSALANWQQKNEDERIEDANLYIKEIFVDEGRQLKRLRPAPQGRGHRIRKRSNHVTLTIDTKVEALGSKAAVKQAAETKPATDAVAEAPKKTTRRSSAKKSNETSAEATA
ncbi:50S ribosomal protein L22 [Hymenobacter aquaticus]|uniref:Large ribosomal subunit protein uL22 n=6 Tax=Hymenobacter TaxID=89966 RepID=A0A4Z0PX74_9BACT|nr:MULTISPECIES: 50S ribosomal protein L22 [Hymenobacter]MCB2407071.1 50S ribosomal protein L22 [Hymenobacter lucidus]PJJ54664.1 large subunit ribosomal protein L22 [Hymenobacter chitinivorans DSM 11115]TGE21909.1 50S ribosomal protein L22 [Hymenobacter aquaticus]TGE27149.1 50S ribosomal protein L22 [Hymenobacter metallicola]UOQ53349.1 50S ribosomal protein L22 [Hymenobacter cellulosivorans]